MTTSKFMKAIEISKFGGPEVCKVMDVPIPRCGKSEVLVKMSHTGINYLDIYKREGIWGGELPFILGTEGAGTVESIGTDVTSVAAGDNVVFRGSVTGTYAEYAVVPAWLTYPLPDDISPEVAVALHLQGMTAHYLVHDVFPMKDTHTCLIHAGAGGVGHLLIQLAKEKGGHVLTTTGNQEKAEIAKSFGADEVIISQEYDFSEAALALTDGQGVDVVFDAVGQATIDGSIASTKFLGIVVLFGDASGITPPVETRKLAAKCIKLTRVGLMPFVPDQATIKRRCEDLLQLNRDGKLNPMIGSVRPLTEASKTLKELSERDTHGKLLLTP